MDSSGTFSDLGGNLIGVGGDANVGFGATSQEGTAAKPLDPLLDPLQNNGGPTVGAVGGSQVLPTEAVLPGSKANDRGSANAPPVDERSDLRDDGATGALPDVGALEFVNAALSVSVSPSAASVAVGGAETFTVTVTNTTGNALPADGGTVTVLLPANFTITSTPAGATVSGNTVTISLGALAANGSATFQVGTTANASGQGLQVVAGAASPDANPSTASGSATVNVQAVALSVGVTASSPNVNLFGVETLTVTVTNTSTTALPAVGSTVQVTLPPGLVALGPVEFTLGALGAGKSATFTVKALAVETGMQMVMVSVANPDDSPATVSASTTVNVQTRAKPNHNGW